MGDPRNLQGSGTAVRALACACALATLVQPSAALAQRAAAKPEANGRPAAGAAVISYEESRGSAIVYLEEGGGMVSQAGVAVAPRRETPASAARAAQAATTSPAPAPVSGSAARSPRVVTRQVADADGAAGRR